MAGKAQAEGGGMMKWLTDWALRTKPSKIIGGLDDPYLIRWHLLPRNPLLNIYLHLFLRSDDDRAEHTHPWANMSILLNGSYTEYRSGLPTPRKVGDVVIRWSGHQQHRIELDDGPCWTIFITGPRYKEWHFVCPQGLVHWRDFTSASDPGSIGKGCHQ